MEKNLVYIEEVEIKYSKTGRMRRGLKGKLPAITPLAKIRFKRFGARHYYGSSEHRPLFTAEAIKYLEKGHIIALQDLKDWDKKKLSAVPGIGPLSATRILACLKHASVKHRGSGYPWELELTVQVPSEDVEILYQYDQAEVEEALAHHVGSSLGVFPRIQAVLLAKKKADLLVEEARLEQDMKKLKKRLVAVSAEAARS